MERPQLAQLAAILRGVSFIFDFIEHYVVIAMVGVSLLAILWSYTTHGGETPQSVGMN